LAHWNFYRIQNCDAWKFLTHRNFVSFKFSTHRNSQCIQIFLSHSKCCCIEIFDVQPNPLITGEIFGPFNLVTKRFDCITVLNAWEFLSHSKFWCMQIFSVENTTHNNFFATNLPALKFWCMQIFSVENTTHNNFFVTNCLL
jgi:hypothetical protein